MSTHRRRLGSIYYFDNPRASVDSSVTYYSLIQCLALDSATILDVGCGRGAGVDAVDDGRPTHDLRSPDRLVIGIDVDPAAACNPVVDDFRLITDGGKRWPVESGSIDLVCADWVLEHVSDPTSFVNELRRVLRPGGAFVARTVSRRSALSLISRAIPNRWHPAVLARFQPGRASEDVFATVYRMNTRAQLATLLSGFQWTTLHRPGLGQYLLRSHRLSAVVEAVESRLPKQANTVLVLSASRDLAE